MRSSRRWRRSPIWSCASCPTDSATVWKTARRLDDLLPESFAATREAASTRPRPATLRRAAHGRCRAPRRQDRRDAHRRRQDADGHPAVALNALDGRGVHVVTVNDYLAKRDTQWMGQVYDALGLSVGLHPARGGVHLRSPTGSPRTSDWRDYARFRAGKRTRPISPTAPTTSLASTTCATTWCRPPTVWCSATWSTPSSTRSTTS